MDYFFDGVALDDPQGRWHLGESGVRTLPARRASSYTIPGQDGEVTNTSAPFEPGQLAFSLILPKRAGGHGDFMERLELLHGILGQRDRLIPFRHDYGNGKVREALVEVVTSTESESPTGDAGVIKVALRIPGSFWHDDTPAAVSKLSINRVGQALPLLSGGTAPIVDPIIKIRGPFATATLTNPANGNFVHVDMALGVDNEVLIDPALHTGSVRRLSDSYELTGLQSLRDITVIGSRLLTPSFTADGPVYRLDTTATDTGPGAGVEILARRAYL